MSASNPLPGWYQVSMAIGRVTFREILREKVLYNVLLAHSCCCLWGFSRPG